MTNKIYDSNGWVTIFVSPIYAVFTENADIDCPDLKNPDDGTTNIEEYPNDTKPAKFVDYTNLESTSTRCTNQLKFRSNTV